MPEGRGEEELEQILTTAEKSVVFFKICCPMAFRKVTYIIDSS
jgi:hypothetical protein